MKTCVVTGSSGLIGSHLCEAFLFNDFRVIGLDREDPPKELRKKDAIDFFICDVSDESDVKRTFKQIDGIDVLVNNAAIVNPYIEPIEDLALSTWEAFLGSNLTSAFLCTKHAVKKLRKSGGSIINIASTRATMSEPHTEAYAATKGGLVSLTHAMACSLAPDVRVNCISPGWIASEDERLSKKDHEQHFSGRVGSGDDIAGLALYLCSDHAEFISGQNIVVDGGMTKKMIYAE